MCVCARQYVRRIQLSRWIVMFFIGVLTGLVDAVIDICISRLTTVKFDLIKKCKAKLTCYTTEVGLAYAVSINLLADVFEKTTLFQDPLILFCLDENHT